MTGTRIAIVMPALAAGERIAAAVDSWQPLARGNDLTIIVVADRDEGVDRARNWADLRIEIRPRPAGWRGRDANARRSHGLAKALALNIDFVLFTDTKVRATPQAIARITDWMVEDGRPERLEALAGCYFDPSADQGLARFLALYADHGLIRKNPRFPEKGMTLKQDRDEAGDSWPVTGALLLTRRSAQALQEAGGFPEDFRVSYEDYSAMQVMLDRGVEVHCDGRFLVAHGNRTGIVDLIREYMRTGWAAAQFRQRFPQSSLGRRRSRQARLVLLAGATGLIAALLAPAFAIMAALGAMLLFGVLNAMVSRRWAALAFGAVFFVSATAFAAGFAHYHLRNGQLGPADARLYAMR